MYLYIYINVYIYDIYNIFIYIYIYVHIGYDTFSIKTVALSCFFFIHIYATTKRFCVCWNDLN